MSRTGAALMLLLAALMHLLACAHGPASTGMGHADAIQIVPAATGQASAPADREPSLEQSGAAENDEVHCCGTDEPTVQRPRDAVLAVPALHDALTAEHRGTEPVTAVPPVQTSPHDPGSDSAGHVRSRLGVWRT
ncbi:hypothetical protein ACFY1L_49635 [Streptomyces sp. NPDC001663]|uniref:hypothetical protein n=1 Tax=Streptomyces sp. NPDC001663 TaxID=3364597 RepID=UPI00368AD6A8